MNKLLFAIPTFIVLLVLTTQPWKNSKREEINVVEIKGNKIKVEIADTPAKRTKGLMYREELEEDGGMLFIFPNVAKHSFWMANTYIPLDIIWINEEKEIVYIEKNTPPCTDTGNLKAICKTYSPDKPAKYVLEINAGYTTDKNINIGDEVIF